LAVVLVALALQLVAAYTDPMGQTVALFGIFPTALPLLLSP
jgi:hypothetical protein